MWRELVWFKCGNSHMTTGLYVAAELVPHCQNKFFFSFLPSSPDSCHYLCWCSEGGGCDSEDSSWLAAGDPPLGPGPSSPLPGGGGYPPPTGREDAQSVQECWEGQRRIHVAYCVFTGVIFISILFLFIRALPHPKWKENGDWSAGDNCIPSAKYQV